MTEAEWESSNDPLYMLKSLPTVASARKLRFFVIACNELASRFSGYEHNPDAIEVAERYAEGDASDDELLACWSELDSSVDTAYTVLCFAVTPDVHNVVTNAIEHTIWRARDSVDFGDGGGEQSPGYEAMEAGERKAVAALLRCIFGNPFRPVELDASWLTSTVTAMAQQMYDARDFSALPILADALQDAGCEHPDILTHCRDDGPHARGCWVVDLLLGKS